MPESVRFESPTAGFQSQWSSKRMRAEPTQIKSMRAAFPVTGPFRAEQPGDFSLLRERLRAAGFTEKSAREVLEGKSDRNIDMAYVIRRTAEPSPFHSLVRLFLLGIPVLMENAVAALSRPGIECALESGLDRRYWQ